MNKVLIVAYSFPPINEAAALRVANFARHLQSFGWAPVVLAPEGGLGRGYGLAVPAGVEEWRVPDPDPIKRMAVRMQERGAAMPHGGTGERTGSGWLRAAYRALLFPDRDVLWAMMAARVALRRLRRRPDIVALLSSASGASKHLAAAWLQRRTGLPWVADFHDPWAADSLEERPRTRLRAWLERRLETDLCRRADRVVTVGEGYVDRLCCDPDKVAVVPAGFEPDDYAGLAPEPPDQPFRIAHTGTLYGGARNPTSLFRAVRLLLEQGRLPFPGTEILLIGPPEPAVAALAAAEGVGHVVRWSGYVPHRVSLELCAGSHMLALITTGGGHETPSKVYEYLAIDRPILALWREGTDVSRLVNAAGAGRVCAPDDVAAIAEYVAETFSLWRDRRQLSRNNRAVVAGLTRRAAAATLAAMLDGLAGGAAPGTGGVGS